DSMGPGDATTRPGVQSAFELLGKQAPAANAEARMETSDAIMKALTMAVSGEKKAMPSWSGNVSTLRAWLRQLSFWEIDNHIPKQRWGIKLFQALNEGSVPRRIAEGIAMEVILSERGYGAILSAVLEKFKPYLDAAGPAAIDMFFFSGDRQRNESFSNYIAAKELAKQEIENLTGETLPPKLAGRILLKQANLTEQQRETMAIRYNALLSFEEVAAALRPLDRPDALLKPMASTSMATVTLGGSTYWQAEKAPMEDQTEKNLEEIPGHEEWDYLPEEDEEAYDEHGEPLLYFEADREYDEDEAVYIWAFNDAYNQILQAWNEEPSSSFPAYQDVRRELQARRKGRQFFRPEAKGRGKGKSKGGRFPGKGKGGRGKSQPRSRKGASKGSADDLLARTRCFSCGELGHFSRDCPNPVPATTSSSAGAHRTTFVVSQGPSKGAINRTFMMTGPNKTVAIYAGVRTAAGEGLVDSAAEDAVIGSGAFQRLKNVLAQQGLQPQPVRGPSGSCAGIGGSARVANLWDVPVGIAKNNGLLRITEVEDCDGFETPFLIPVSFQELVGMVIDYDRAEVRTRQGNSTPMHRLPSGHRSVSVVEFDGKWSLPKELMTQGQQKGVAVWLRKSLVVPSECLPLEIANQLDSSRVTYLDAAPDVDPYIINDVWCKPEPQRHILFYCLTLSEHYGYHSFFAPGILGGGEWAENGGPFPRELQNMQQRIRSLVHGEGEGVQPKAAARCRGATWCERSWARIVMIMVRMIATARQQLVVDSLILDAYAPSASASSSTTAPAKSQPSKKKEAKVRQGLGTQLSRSQAQTKWTLEPEQCPHEEQDLRMRGNQARHWWACLKCGSRWERVETDTVENPAGQVATDEAYADNVDYPGEPLDYTTREADMFQEEPLYQFEPANRSEGSMSISDPSLALAISEGQTRTLDRVNLQALRGHRDDPREWADYEQTQGPMEMPHRRSRSLPAGPEVFAIHENRSDEDKDKDVTLRASLWSCCSSFIFWDYPAFGFLVNFEFAISPAGGRWLFGQAVHFAETCKELRHRDYVYSCLRPHRCCSQMASMPTEDEAQAEAFDQDEIEADEALEEVRQSLRPVTESTKVAEALKNVDDFRRHEEFGKFSLHPQLRREIFKVHRNLNHPSKEVFLRALKHAGTKDEIIAWVKEHFSCPLCESARRPMAARPAHLARCLTFNSVIAIDLFYLNLFGAEKIFLVCVDHGTGYVQVARCRDAKAVTVRQELCRAWVQPFGVPGLILCDQGPEFMGSQFQEHMSQLGAAVHYTDGASPWQNGKAERTVQTLKNKILLTIKDITAHEEELDVVVAHVVSAYNSMYDRHGFTPDQRVFGRSVRMPASLLADDRLNQELLMESAGDAVQRSWDIRSAARQAWLKKDDAEAVRRARRVQTRSTDVHSYTLQPGQRVYVWRRSEHRHGWTGPGALIAQVPGGTSWWINVRGRLWKASAEQIRPAADEEDLGASLMIELHRDLTKQLKEGRQVTFQDITDEGGPQDPAEDDLSELFDLDRRSNPREELNETVEEAEPGSSALPDSRRQSVSSAPVLPEEEMQEASEALDSGGRDFRRIIKVDEGSSGTMSFGPVPSQPSQRSQPYFGQTTQINPSNYLDVMDFDSAADATTSNYWMVGGPHWVRQTTSGRSFLKPLSPKTYFQASAAEASYCAKDRCMYVGKAKSSFGQVEFAKLQNVEKALFRKAREKELQSLLENKAVKILSLKESAEFRRLHPEAILESRFVDRYKPAGIKPEELKQARQDAIEKGELKRLELSEDHTSPKSRWCVVGWKDPQIHQIERSAPTPSSASINVVLQLIASRKWCGYLRDVKTAFLQSRPTDRRVPIACTQPRDECMPGLHPEQLILLLTEVYGLVSGPSWWRSSLLQRLYKHNYHLCPYESCILLLPGDKPGDPTEGVIVIEVDDLVEAGSQKHRDKLAVLEKEIRFGKITNLLEASEQESTYAGRTLRQLQDHSFVTHMEEYIYTRLAPITLAKKTLKKDAAETPLDPSEITQLRGVIAALSWVSRECRPDAAAAASILASCFPEPTVEHAQQANEVIRQLKQFPLRLHIHSIAETKVRNVVISDAAFDTTGKEKSQHGYLVGFTNDEMNVGKPAPVSLTRWCSRRLRRKASSSMLCEAIALSAATAALEKQDALWDALRISFYNPRQRQRTEAETLELQGKSSVIATEAPLYRDPRSLAIIDAKALFDSLLSDQPCDCERTNLEIAVIRESLQVCRARTRWVPHNVNPADALTKFQGCHLEPLVKMLKSSRYQISDEDE
ncbi:unnamed protein product, partial [Symbiodinium sp. KB8]